MIRNGRKHLASLAALAALCVAVAVVGSAIALAEPQSADTGIQGCYVYDANIFINPLSSFMPYDGMPYVYGFKDDAFIIADTETGDIETYTVKYCETPVDTDEFSSRKDGLFAEWLPSLSRYQERYLLAVMPGKHDPELGLYRMDDEIWLVQYHEVGIWSIYRLKSSETPTLVDLERAREQYGEGPKPAQWPALYENQMTLQDVYALARKGEALTLQDFERYYYQLVGFDFTTRRFDVVGADTVFVRATEGRLVSALLMSGRTLDPSEVIDLREGFGAVAQYMNPLNTFDDITIVDPGGGDNARELIYESDYDQCRYYLDTTRADRVFVIFESGERLPLKQALDERRITVEDAIARGLQQVSMVPIDNPLSGEFPIQRQLYIFELNGEAFYPSMSFMYVVWDDDYSVYYDIDELTKILEWYGYGAKAETLRKHCESAETVPIACGNYVRDTVLADAGIESNVGWAVSSHTPVRFHIK